MNILGISSPFEPAACLLADGKLVAAAEEERFNRIKFYEGFPHQAVAYCLKSARLSLSDIDYIAYNFKPLLQFQRCVTRNLYLAPRSPHRSLYYMASAFNGLIETTRELYLLRKKGGARCAVENVEHHTAHLYSTFPLSGFTHAAVITYDFRGEAVATTWNHVENGKIVRLKEFRIPDSLGMLYSSLTHFLGFRASGDEYKVMGLASYGTPAYYEQFRDVVRLLPRGEYRFNRDYFSYDYNGVLSDKFHAVFGPRRKKDDPVEEKHANIAASLQKMLEDTVLHMLRELQALTGESNLCVAGGVGLNCAVNGRLWQKSGFKNIYVPAAPNDPGSAIGAAMCLHSRKTGRETAFALDHPYWGPSFSNEDIRKELDVSKVAFTACPDPAKLAAQKIAEGKIVGWFQGRMEWGPRALGSRSILADPRQAGMKDILNKYVKHREDFRPFAPSVLEEEAQNYFECPPWPSPFMSFIFNVRPDKRSAVPAITHIDGTARIQTVSRKTNPLYWQLIKEFQGITGVPLVLNTSFNVQGEPIVCTPHDALKCFWSTGLDCLVIGNYYLDKGK